MKKRQIAFIVLCVIFSLTACGKGSGKDSGAVGTNEVVEGISTEEKKIVKTPDVDITSGNESSSESTEEISTEELNDTEESDTAENSNDNSNSSFIDLTELSATMVYSEVFQMMYYPENYVGKYVKMEGIYDHYHDDATDKDYYACIIQDATACCAQGIEFQLSDGNYPGDDTFNVTVEGTFSTYEENGMTYCTLVDAVLD